MLYELVPTPMYETKINQKVWHGPPNIFILQVNFRAKTGVQVRVCIRRDLATIDLF
jgi:hypothetical protein